MKQESSKKKAQKDKLQLTYKPHFPTCKEEKAIIRETVRPMTFREARRLRISLYDALLLELWEDMYQDTAREFEHLIMFERKLLEGMFIKEQVIKYPQLLLNLYDHCRTVERIGRNKSPSDAVKILRLLNNCTLLLRPYRKQFGWLILKSYDIIIRLCREMGELEEEAANEEKCLLFYNYGLYLMEESWIDDAMRYFKYAMSLARHHAWFFRDMVTFRSVSMYQTIITTMADGIQKQSNELLLQNPAKLVKYSKLCINCLVYNLKINMNNIMKMFVVIVEALLEINDITEAQHRIEMVRNYMIQYNNKNAFILDHEVKYLYLAGRVSYELGSIQEALVILRKGELLSRKLTSTKLQGKLLYHMGRLQACQPSMRRLSLATLDKAKLIIQAHPSDGRELKVIHYMKAIAKMRLIFPFLIDALRHSKEFSMDFYNLFHWKNRCNPFWRNLRAQSIHYQDNKLGFLLDEFYSHKKFSNQSRKS